MSMFSGIETSNETQEAVDSVGGYAKIDKTGFYEMEIEKAYGGTSSGGAFSVTIHFKGKNKDGRDVNFTQTEYISSGTAKGCKNYYIDKDGNKQYLPGYNKIKNLDALLGFVRDYPQTTAGNVMLWDRDVRAEVPQTKEIITEWIGKKVGCLIKVGMKDKYNDEFNSVDFVEVEHFLDAMTGQTRNEKVAGTNGFKDKWLLAFPEDYKKDERDKSKGAKPVEGTPDASGVVVPDNAPF